MVSLPLAYAGIPYQVLRLMSGSVALMRTPSRSAMARSDPVIPAIFARTSDSLFVFPAGCSRTASFIEARSSSGNPAYR